jgi:sugar phosphate isomerase/epimerase
MKLGIGTYCYMWSIGFPGAQPQNPMTALDLLAKAREFGLYLVQYGPNLSLGTLPEPHLSELLARAREWGIELEVGTRGLNAEHLRGQLLLAKRVGSKILRTVPELESGQTPSGEELIGSLQAILPDFAAARIKLAMENGQMPTAVLDQVIRSLSSPWVGITLDTVNSHAILEGPEQVVRTLAPHTVCLHIKDFVVKRVWHMMGFVVEGRPAGQGQLNVPWLLGVLRAAGASSNAILELWPPEQKSLEETITLERAWVAESISYLRRLIPD